MLAARVGVCPPDDVALDHAANSVGRRKRRLALSRFKPRQGTLGRHSSKYIGDFVSSNFTLTTYCFHYCISGALCLQNLDVLSAQTVLQRIGKDYI